jgi:hypothetical protein
MLAFAYVFIPHGIIGDLARVPGSNNEGRDVALIQLLGRLKNIGSTMGRDR